MKKILIMNGPNLNLLGEREPNIYGNETLNTINDDLDEKARKLGYEPVFFQSNSEGGLIDRLHESRLDCARSYPQRWSLHALQLRYPATLSRRYAFR